MARGLKGAVLKGFADHRTTIGRIYTEIYRDKQDELGALPRSARPILREYARLVIELDQNATEAQKPSLRKRPTEFRRLKREIRAQRFTLLKLEQRLYQMANQQQASVDHFAELHNGEEAKA